MVHCHHGEGAWGVVGGEQERRRSCKKSQYIYGLLYKSYYNTMVHSIEFTKIWTNIYSKTHPQRKHFSSKTSYIQMTESIRTDNPKIYWFSSLQGQGEEGKKIRNPWPFKSRDLFNDNKSFQRKIGPHIRNIANPSWGAGGGRRAGSQGFGEGSAQHFTLNWSQPRLMHADPMTGAHRGTARDPAAIPWPVGIFILSWWMLVGKVKIGPQPAGLHK